jgi:hypothetical protein
LSWVLLWLTRHRLLHTRLTRHRLLHTRLTRHRLLHTRLARLSTGFRDKGLILISRCNNLGHLRHFGHLLLLLLVLTRHLRRNNLGHLLSELVHLGCHNLGHLLTWHLLLWYWSQRSSSW